MSNNTITSLDQLQEVVNKSKTKNTDAPTFKAPNLVITVTRQDTGDQIGEYVLESRGFKSGNKEGSCGVGWYDSPGQGRTRDDGGNFAGRPLSCAFRVSLKGVKVPADSMIDITGDE